MAFKRKLYATFSHSFQASIFLEALQRLRSQTEYWRLNEVLDDR